MSASNPLGTPSLPAELLDSILVFVDSTVDLLSVCLANSFLRNVAVRHLYRSIRLHRCLSTIHLCHALLSQPVLALYVVSLEVTFGNVPDWQVRQWMPHPIFQPTFAPAYFRLFFHTIKEMKNLKDVTFIDASVFIRLPSGNLGLSLPPLKRIAFTRNKNIDLVLKYQSSLEELAVTDVFDPSLARLSSSALPHLRRIRCPKIHLAVILPQGNIDHIHITDSLDIEDIIHCAVLISDSRCPLKSLELVARGFSEDTFQPLSAWLPHLEELVIHDLSHTPFTGEVLRHQNTLTSFGNFRCLRRLGLYTASPHQEQNFLTLVTGLGDVCPTLSEVLFVDPRTTWQRTGRANMVYCYTRDALSTVSQWKYQAYYVPFTERVGSAWN